MANQSEEINGQPSIGVMIGELREGQKWVIRGIDALTRQNEHMQSHLFHLHTRMDRHEGEIKRINTSASLPKSSRLRQVGELMSEVMPLSKWVGVGCAIGFSLLGVSAPAEVKVILLSALGIGP